MYSLFKLLSTRSILTKQLPTFGIAFVVAEIFYKFHSFTLECIAFLVTWFVLDAVATVIESHFFQDGDLVNTNNST